MALKIVPKSTDVSRQRIQDLIAKIEAEKDTHAMNLNAALGAIQALKMLLVEAPQADTK